jgi:putative endonuclease
VNARQTLGRQGEDLACEMLRRRGFLIEDRNFRCRGGEIDVVASRGSTLVFCEVKTRVSLRWGEPAESVGHVKQARLRQAAAAWCRKRRRAASDIRFDVISVLKDASGTRVQWLRDAF